MLAAPVNTAYGSAISNQLPRVGISTPTPAPRVVIPNASLPVINEGFYTDSPLLYVADDHNITVIEVDTNKVVDVIYTNKYRIVDIAVSPDYYTLYVLYKDQANPAKLQPGDDDPWASFIMTIDLYTKRVVADTWYTGDYSYLIGGSPTNLVLSPGGVYLYYATNWNGNCMIFQYNAATHEYTRGVNTRKLLNPNGYFDSNGWDLTISPDGKYLYFADVEYNALAMLNLPDLTLRKMYYPLGMDMEAWSLAISPDLGRYYLAGDLEDEDGYGLAAIDVAAYDAGPSDSVSGFKFSSLLHLIRLGPDGQTMYVIEPYETEVVGYKVYAPSDYHVYPTGSQPDDLKFSPDGKRMYIYCYGNSYVKVYDLSTYQQVPGTPIAIGPDRHLVDGWTIGRNHRMCMGPKPEWDVLVNDSAYKAHRLSALPSLASAAGPVKYAGSMVDMVNNATGPGWSSFTLEPDTGRLVLVDLSGFATVTPKPKPSMTVPGPKVTIVPFPGLSWASPDPQVNQSQDQNQSQQSAGNASATPPGPSEVVNTPKPQASVTATPGFGAIVSVACLAIATLAVKRRKD